MGNKFKVVWDDFTGGYFVGENDAKQPRNTWTGTNVNAAKTDGSLVTANAIEQISIPDASGTDWVIEDNSIYFNGTSVPLGNKDSFDLVDSLVVNNAIYLVINRRYTPPAGNSVNKMRIVRIFTYDNSPTQVAMTEEISGSITVTSPPSNIVSIDGWLYVSFNNTLYRYNSSFTNGGTFHSSVPFPNAGQYLTFWNTRLISWGGNSSTFFFSDAYDYMSWPTLNYVQVGGSTGGNSAIIPRFNELLIVKPDGIYSLIGTLSINASIRKVYDGINFSYGSVRTPKYIYSTQNSLFFIDRTTFPFSANIEYIYGQQNGVSAYYNFGRTLSDNAPTISGSFSDILAATFPSTLFGQNGFFSLIKTSNNRWMRVYSPLLTFYDPTPSLKTNYVFRYFNLINARKEMYFLQYGYRTPGSISIAIAKFLPEQVGAGSNYTWINGNTNTSDWSGFSTPTLGTVVLSPLETENLSKITSVFVETELDLDPMSSVDTAGTASMSVQSINQAVDDIPFTTTNYTSSSMTYSTNMNSFGSPYAYPARDASISRFGYPVNPQDYPSVNQRLKNTRIIRFYPDDAGYGYKHNVSITFSGYKIKRVWVEGETR